MFFIDNNILYQGHMNSKDVKDKYPPARFSPAAIERPKAPFYRPPRGFWSMWIFFRKIIETAHPCNKKHFSTSIVFDR
jgi:hypothetical protein